MNNASQMQSWATPPTTAAAGTVIVVFAKPNRSKKTKLLGISYTSAGTAHTLTALMPLAFCTLTADAAAAQAVVNINRNPGAFAANAVLDKQPVPSVADNLMAASDYVALQLPDGNIFVTTVSSIATLAVTLAANVPTGGALKGAKLWFYGITTDTNPSTRLAHPAWLPAVSATTAITPPGDGLLCQTPDVDSPMIIVSSNATAAGTINGCTGVYGP